MKATLDTDARDTLVEALKWDGDVFTDDLAYAFSTGDADLARRSLSALAAKVQILDSLGWADHGLEATYTLEVTPGCLTPGRLVCAA